MRVSFMGIARHFMGINTKMLDIGMFDTLIEMQAPSKDQRYQIVRELIADD